MPPEPVTILRKPRTPAGRTPVDSGLERLEGIDLSSLDKSGSPKKPSRLSSAAAARDLYTEAIRADQNSAVARVRVQAMKDGEPPYNPAALIASGQGSRANANFLMGQDLISKADNGYNDIITSAKTLMTIAVDGGEPTERVEYQRIIATELTRTIRKWPSFIPNFLRLVDTFVTHGVAVEYAPDDRDFRFEVAGLGDFLVPRQVPASEERVPYAFARKDMLVTELYEHIENEKAATALGWNVNAVRAAIGNATTKLATGNVGEIERYQQQIKNNDIHASKKFAHVPVLNTWVREFDGTISFFILEKDNPTGDFLFKQYSRYETVAEAFNFFCYGIGNGTLHSIRGMGQMIFALVQLHNKLMCSEADSAMLNNALLVQAPSGNALQDASFTFLGPMAMMPPGFEIVDRHFTKQTTSLPLLNEVKNLMGQTSSRFMASTEQSKGTYRNKDNIASELEQNASSDSGAVDLFMASLDRTIRRMCKRIVKGPKSDPLVKEFHDRTAKAGVPQDILDSIDHDSTYAYRTLGAGSPAARTLSFSKLMQILPQLDEVGRKNLIYEFVANEVGYQNVEEFASKAEEPRYNTEASLATVENILLAQRNPVQVLPGQMHATHVQIHMPPAMQLLDAIASGEADPMQQLPALQTELDHISAHGEQLAQDPTQLALYGQVKEAVNNIQQVVTNMGRKIQAHQQQVAEQAQQQPPQEGDPNQAQQPDPKAQAAQLDLALKQLKLDLAQKKGDLELALIQAKANQTLALNDAKSAMAAQAKLQYPLATRRI